jgi:hypothetical protein
VRNVGGVVRVVTIGVTHYYTCLRIFSFYVRREKLSLLVPPSLPGRGRAPRGAGGRRDIRLRSRPPAYASETRLYLHSVRFSPPRPPSASTTEYRTLRTGNGAVQGPYCASSGHTTQIHTLVACATRGRRAHMVAHTSKRGLLAHRIDGLEPDIELSSGLIFGDWDNMNILQGGCRYQGR